MKDRTELLFTFFSQPRQAMKYILDDPPFGFIFIVFLFALANLHIATAANSASLYQNLGVYFSFGFFFKVLVTFVLLLILVSLVHFISDLMGSTASASNLYLLFMVSLVPFIFATPAVLLSTTLYALILFILLAWVIVLQVLSIQVVYRISLGKALFIYAVPYIFLGVLFPLVIVLSLIVSLFSVM